MTVSPGRTFPLGASVVDGGVNFCVFSRKANAVELLLFDGAGAAEPARVIRLDAPAHRTYHYWHAFVPGLARGTGLRLPRDRPLRSGARAPLRSREGPPRPLRARRRRS